MATTGGTSAHYALKDPDVRLMLAVRDGDDREAFEKLVDNYQHRLVSVLNHLVRNRDEAEDLAQDVFLRVYRSRETYRPRAKFSTWLFTIANNLALNKLRSMKRKPTVSLSVRESGPLGPRPEEQLAQARDRQPHHRMQQAEMAEIVREAIDGLNERQRMAVLLNKFEDMPYAEIAAVMEMTTKAVKSLLSRARANLRIALQDLVRPNEEEAPSAANPGSSEMSLPQE